MKERRFSHLSFWSCKGLVGTLAVCGGMATSQLAIAQSTTDAQQQSTTAGAPDGHLMDIVVTAQRRSENLQDVPIAVSAMSGEHLADMHLTNARDLTVAVPGLLYNQGGGTTQTYLRGVGSSITQVNGDPSVATYIDGVYVALSTVTAVRLSDIESVEVLKGPQGTLYGRNATGGAVSITTRLPTQDFRAELSGGIGNYARREASASISGPLADNLFAGVYFNYEGRNAYSKLENSVVPKPDVRGTDYQWTARAKLVFEPTSDLKFVATADRAKYASLNDFAWRQLQPDAEGYGNATIGAPGVPNNGKRSFSTNQPVDNNWTSDSVSLKTEIDLGPVRLMELSAYRDSKSFFLVDNDATEAQITGGAVSIAQRSRMTSHELQLQSDHGGPLKWIVGGFYYRENGTVEPFTLIAPAVNQVINSQAITTSLSAFSQATWTIVDSLDLTLGARYTHEKKRYTGGTLVTTLPTGAVVPSTFGPIARTYNEFTPKAVLSYRFDDTMVYASFSKGFKSGVYNLFGTTPVSIGPVNPERINAYEIGVKSEFFDKTVRWNNSFFYYDYKDLQVQVVDSAGISSIQNAARATLKGIDTELVWAVTPELQLRLNGEYLDTRYDSFVAFQGRQPRDTPRGGNIDVPGGVNVTGFPTARSPKFSGTAGFTWNHELPSGSSLAVISDVFYTDGYSFNPDATARQKAYATVAGSIEYSAPNKAWSVSVWARNLTNSYYYEFVQINAYGLYANPAPPRTFGITGTVRFGRR